MHLPFLVFPLYSYIVFMKDPYPEASKLRRIAKGRGALFDDYIKYNIEPLFDNTLMYDDGKCPRNQLQSQTCFYPSFSSL